MTNLSRDYLAEAMDAVVAAGALMKHKDDLPAAVATLGTAVRYVVAAATAESHSRGHEFARQLAEESIRAMEAQETEQDAAPDLPECACRPTWGNEIRGNLYPDGPAGVAKLSEGQRNAIQNITGGYPTVYGARLRAADDKTHFRLYPSDQKHMLVTSCYIEPEHSAEPAAEPPHGICTGYVIGIGVAIGDVTVTSDDGHVTTIPSAKAAELVRTWQDRIEAACTPSGGAEASEANRG